MSEAISAIGGSKSKASDTVAAYRKAKMNHVVPKNKLGSSAQVIAMNNIGNYLNGSMRPSIG